MQMTQRAIKGMMEEFLQLMRQEQEHKVELFALDFSVGSHEKLNLNLERQRALLGEISSLRSEKMLPILRDLSAFIGNTSAATSPR